MSMINGYHMKQKRSDFYQDCKRNRNQAKILRVIIDSFPRSVGIQELKDKTSLKDTTIYKWCNQLILDGCVEQEIRGKQKAFRSKVLAAIESPRGGKAVVKHHPKTQKGLFVMRVQRGNDHKGKAVGRFAGAEIRIMDGRLSDDGTLCFKAALDGESEMDFDTDGVKGAHAFAAPIPEHLDGYKIIHATQKTK